MTWHETGFTASESVSTVLDKRQLWERYCVSAREQILRPTSRNLQTELTFLLVGGSSQLMWCHIC